MSGFGPRKVDRPKTGSENHKVRSAVGALYLAWLWGHFSLRVTQTIPQAYAVKMHSKFVCLCLRLA